MRQNQKLRVILDGVHFYCTRRFISENLGSQKHARAVAHCLDILENARPRITGISTRVESIDIQLDIL